MRRFGTLAAGTACMLTTACGSSELSPPSMAISANEQPLRSAIPSAIPSLEARATTSMANQTRLSRHAVAAVFDEQFVAAQSLFPDTRVELVQLKPDQTFTCTITDKKTAITESKGNANLYCVNEDTIVIDTPFINKIVASSTNPGSVLRFFLSHEIGHAIQKSVSTPMNTPKQMGELQADCYAARVMATTGEAKPTIVKSAQELFALASDPELSAVSRTNIVEAALSGGDCKAFTASLD